jgi:hypothetical protein
MAKAVNTFLKSKMNKDLDARIIPNGEYRDAQNVQISRSEGDTVGSLENILGVKALENFENITGVSNLECIGLVKDDVNNHVYLFFTDYTDLTNTLTYSETANNFIFQYNTLTATQSFPENPVLLVKGSFLNFSKTNPIYAANVLETFLFWTDNRNQPRKINIKSANPSRLSNPTYYTTEDQISVAKYNPYQSIELWKQSDLLVSPDEDFETTMKDVTSKHFPNGGLGNSIGIQSSNIVDIDGVTGYIYEAGDEYGLVGSRFSILQTDGTILDTGETVSFYTETSGAFTITLTGSVSLEDNQEVVFNANPYYNNTFAGDPDFLEDKFVRFSYRFKFEDNEYSIMAPFTQPTFIPKQDGYFMYQDNNDFSKFDDQANAFRSTIVAFMENKVNNIDLRIPLPYLSYNLSNSLKVKEVDILYKESDKLSVKVVDTIDISTIQNQSATCLVNGAITSSTSVVVDNILGGINVGSKVYGTNVTDGVYVDSFDSSTSTVTLNISQTLPDDTELTIGEPDYYVYDYQSKKPYKTLPESEIIRVYDKVPVRALGQEVSGNRVIYANYQDKHTPPTALNYNVACTQKFSFSINKGTATSLGNFTNTNIIVIDPIKGQNINIGSYITIESGGGAIPEGTQVTLIQEDTPSAGQWTLYLTNNVTLVNNDVLIFEPGGDVQNTTSSIEYPNHTVKTNRNYQVGVVLSDRYGRQSTVILSNNLDTITVGSQSYAGSTLYHPYFSESLEQEEWRGDSLKMLFNDPISPFNKDVSTGWPGVYNGDSTSAYYNPLGWFSYKIVVKQTEQDYYNVYLPGIMNSYPNDTSLEIGKTSHAVLINDNINKIPRDLSEVGPDQKQYRSSVQLFGRVENTTHLVAGTDYGLTNTQYYPGRTSDTASTISTLRELFNYDSTNEPRPNYFPQFYAFDSNPLVARISTTNQIGQIASTNYNTSSGISNAAVSNTDTFVLKNVNGTPTFGQIVLGGNIPDGVTIISWTPSANPNEGTIELSENITIPIDTVLTFNQTSSPGLQYLAVYETEPVESLLDIFWETSTAGLVNDLNDAVLNANQGAAELSSFNTGDWTEAYTAGQEILTVDIYLVDNFGQTIPTSEIDTPLYLESVIDLTEPSGQNRDNFFNFINTVDNYTHNIEITQEYYDEIFYGYDSSVRTFIFTFKAVVNGVETTFIKTEGVSNVDPSFDNCPLVPQQIPQSQSNVYTFQGVNGANNTALRNLDLEYNIESVIASQAGDVTDLNYFSMPSSLQVINGTFFDGTLVNNFAGDPEMPFDTYTIRVNLVDAGGEAQGSTFCDVTIDFGTTPVSVVSYLYEVLCQGETVDDYYSFVIFEIDDQSPALNGFYLYSGPNTFATGGMGGAPSDTWAWDKLLEIAGGGAINIDATNAATGGSVCADWWYHPTSKPDLIDLWENACPCSPSGSIDNIESIDFDEYFFNIT